MDVGLTSIDYKGNKVSGIANNGSSTSQINFRGTEDLGSGLKAEFRVETDWNVVSNKANTGDVAGSAASSFANGEIRVGLASNTFGRVDLGAVNYNTLTTFTTGQPFGTAIGSGFRAVTLNDVQGVVGLNAQNQGVYKGMGASSVRSDNAIKYTSPSFYGFSGSLYFANKQANAVGNNFSSTLGAYDMQGTKELGLGYANGPLAVSFSSLKQDYEGLAMNGAGSVVNAINATVNTLGANYAFGPAKVYGLYQNTKMDGGSGAGKLDYWALSGTYNLGSSVVLMASYGELKDKTDGASKDKAKLFALGADYNLSKRTALYARYEDIKDGMGAIVISSTAFASTSSDKRTRTAIGVRHAF